MKIINLSFIVVFFIICSSCTYLAQYKLNTGNFWVYTSSDQEWKISINDTTILFDSLLFYESTWEGKQLDKNKIAHENSLRHFIRKKENGLFEELNINSELEIEIQPYVYKENAQLGDKWIYLLHYKSDSVDIDTIWSAVTDVFEGFQFGQLKSIKEIHYKSGNPQGLVDYYKYFCDDFGELSEQNYSMLKGCYIDGKAYGDTSFIVVGIEYDKNEISNFQLLQNFPNPFNPSTTISFILPKDEFVKIVVFNNLGESVATILDEYLESGNYQVPFNPNKFKNITSGIYYYQLTSRSFLQTKKMIYLR